MVWIFSLNRALRPWIPAFAGMTQKGNGSIASVRNNREFGENGAPRTIRTSDPQIRSLVLYPAELWVRGGVPIGPAYQIRNPFILCQLRDNALCAG